MKYSEITITDDNSDAEMECLADQNGYRYNQYIGFVDKLDNGFTVQQNKNGYEEWVTQKVSPNHSIDCIAPIIEAWLAYEFANGFMLFMVYDSMWD